MKVGSIVECVDDSNYHHFIANIKCPKAKFIYTVRAIKSDNGLLLEEIINPIHEPSGHEFGFFMWRFRELLPPMEIQDALDSCEPVLIEITPC